MQIFAPFRIIFWLLVCRTSCCFHLFVTYCHSSDLSFFSPASLKVSHRPEKKKKGGKDENGSRIGTYSSIQHIFFLLKREIFVTLSKMSTYFQTNVDRGGQTSARVFILKLCFLLTKTSSVMIHAKKGI